MTLSDAFYVLFCTYVGLLPGGRSYFQILNLYAICEFVLPSELEPSVNLLNLVSLTLLIQDFPSPCVSVHVFELAVLKCGRYTGRPHGP